MSSEPIRPTPMKAMLTLSLAPVRLPEKRAAAPAALRKPLRPVDACAMPLVVSGFRSRRPRGPATIPDAVGYPPGVVRPGWGTINAPASFDAVPPIAWATTSVGHSYDFQTDLGFPKNDEVGEPLENHSACRQTRIQGTAEGDRQFGGWRVQAHPETLPQPAYCVAHTIQ